jgi:ABC-type Na+ efflux pump permease subunit
MRQFVQIVRSEISMAFKNFYAVYVMVMPMVILLVLRFFLPSVESTTVTVAVVADGPHAVEAGLIEEMRAYADVAEYESIEAVEQKLRGAGSAEGLYWDPEAEQYVSLMERNIPENALFSVGARAVRQYYVDRNYPSAPQIVSFSAGVPPELADRTKNSPVATIGGAVFVAAMTIMMGFIIGVSVVRDKELGTDRAIRVSPVSRAEYYLGKCVCPVLGLLNVSVLQIYTVALVSVSVVLIFGLLVGGLARNENEALGLVKSIGTVLLLGVLGGTLLPDAWQWIVYWVPLYWIYDAAEGIFALTATWGDVAWRSGVLLALSLVAFLALRTRIEKGLS